MPFVIPSKERAPFHWANKTRDKYMCVKLYTDSLTTKNDEFDWSCGFPIAELGTLSLQNRQIRSDSREAE